MSTDDPKITRSLESDYCRDKIRLWNQLFIEISNSVPSTTYISEVQQRTVVAFAAEIERRVATLLSQGPVKEKPALSDSIHDRDVHTEHCCSVHGCKYGNSECSVETGRKIQSSLCEMCNLYPGDEDPFHHD